MKKMQEYETDVFSTDYYTRGADMHASVSVLSVSSHNIYVSQ